MYAGITRLALAGTLALILSALPQASPALAVSGQSHTADLERLRPLHMSHRARAHIRGRPVPDAQRRPITVTGARQESAAARRLKPRPVRAESPRSSPYPLPPWLKGIRVPDLPIRFTPQVYRYLSYYRTSRTGRSILRGWLSRMPRFQALIFAQLERLRLPRSLIYVAMAESGFKLRTVSRAGAAGLWQFMPYSGRIYGLEQSFWVDERFNPERSSTAVIYYLKDLLERFGNWELALAAFNAGYNGVLRAIRKYNTNDYWRLCAYEAGLPYETRHYVPKIFAIAVVAHNLARFGLRPGTPSPAWEYALVTVPPSTHLGRVSRRAGIPLQKLRWLNPELRRNRTPPRSRYELRLPRTALARYLQHRRRGGHARYVTIVVKRGDSLKGLAADYGVSVSRLRQINQIRARGEVRPGVRLLVPAAAHRRKKARPDERPIIAVTSQNHIPPGLQPIYYRAVKGDTLPQVARALGVRVRDLIFWNALDPTARLQPGMVLRALLPRGRSLPGVRLLDPATSHLVTVNTPRFHSLHLRRQGRERIIYRVRRGDTVRRIARRFGISVGAIARENNISRRARLRSGRQLVIYTRRRRQRLRRPRHRSSRRPQRKSRRTPRRR